MSSSEIIDFSIKTYQSLGWTILKLTALPTLFAFSGLAFFSQFIAPLFTSTTNPDSVSHQIGEALFAAVLAFGVAAPISFIGISLSSSIVAKLVSDYIEGRPPNPAAAVRGARQSLWKLVGLNLYVLLVGWSVAIVSGLILGLGAIVESQNPDQGWVAGLTAVLGTFGFVIGLFVLLVVLSRFSLAPAAMLTEGVGTRRSVQRSVELLRTDRAGTHPSGYGPLWTLYGILFILTLILLPSFSFIQSLLQTEEVVQSLGEFTGLATLLRYAFDLLPTYLFLWVIIPIWTTTTTVLYFERRIRLEGLDIEFLARNMWRNAKESRFEL